MYGSFYRCNNILSSEWRQQDITTTYVPKNIAIGIGTTITQGYDLYVNGNIRTSNIVIAGQLILENSNTLIPNKLQLAPVKSSFVVNTAEQNIFSLFTTGVFQASARNTDVYVNGLKLAYSNESIKDYDVYSSFVGGSNTAFQVDLVYPAQYNDIVDIVVFPSFIDNSNAINSPGYVYQQITNTLWLPNNSDIYLAQNGNVGIGTNFPTNKVDIAGSISISSSSTSTYIENTYPTYRNIVLQNSAKTDL